MTTLQMFEARRWRLKQATKDLQEAGKLDSVPWILEKSAIRIGQYGWWRSGWPKPLDSEGNCPCCIWLATEAELEIFGRANPELADQAKRVAEEELIAHFHLDTTVELFNLNDSQPDYEGQGWAIYHLNTLARQLRARHRLQGSEPTHPN